jgi:hypothetical protein
LAKRQRGQRLRRRWWGPGTIHHLDGQKGFTRGVGRRRRCILEIMPGGHPRSVRGERQPVPIARRATEQQFETALLVHVETVVVENSRRLRAHPARFRPLFHRHRDVDRPTALAANPVDVIARHRCVEIDRVGIVAGELAPGLDDPAELRRSGVAFEHPGDPALEQMHDGTMRADHIVGTEEVPLLGNPPTIDLVEEVDQFAESPARLGFDDRHFDSSPSLRSPGPRTPSLHRSPAGREARQAQGTTDRARSFRLQS